MRILHVPYCFYPDPSGGTEKYAGALAHGLLAGGKEVSIAAPAPTESTYTWQDIPVDRFQVSLDQTLDIILGEGDPAAAEGFGRILDHRQPDIVHLHARSPGVSLRLIRETKRRGIPILFTFHTPTVSCARGTLLEMGRTPCDGVLRVTRCSACSLHGHGVPAAVAAVLARFPRRPLAAAGNLAPRRIETALRYPSEIARFHDACRAFLGEVDHIVAVSAWITELLIKNGVSASKISLCRNGLAQAPPARDRPPRPDGPLRLAYLGRIDPPKGLHVLLDAVRLIPSALLQLDIYPIVQTESSDPYLNRLRAAADGDERITWRAPITGDVVDVLRRYDMLAIPSVGLESSPLVVFEALAAGVPVLGSDLGGLAEIIANGVNGVLVPPGRPDRWAAVLDSLVSDLNLMEGLRSNVSAPRNMTDVVVDMERIYSTLTTAGKPATASTASASIV